MLWSLYLLSGCSKKLYLQELDAGTQWAKTLLFLWKEAEQLYKLLWKEKKKKGRDQKNLRSEEKLSS